MVERKPPKRIRAETIFRTDHGRAKCRAQLPAAVRDYLDGQVGDKLVFHEGCDRAVTLAALNGRYFVVTLEPNKKAAQQAPIEDAPAVQIESLTEAINRRMSKR